jgi:hypothetical protein
MHPSLIYKRWKSVHDDKGTTKQKQKKDHFDFSNQYVGSNDLTFNPI